MRSKVFQEILDETPNVVEQKVRNYMKSRIKYEELEIFVNRLKRIGINVMFIGNFPWVYLDTVNGIPVEGTYLSDHRFTAFWVHPRGPMWFRITDIGVVFKKIRETLNLAEKELIQNR